VGNPSGHVDPPTCREDLVRKAAGSNFTPDFDWITEKEALRVTEDPRNRGLTAVEIREIARDWILGGGEIDCVKETREGYKEKSHFHYDIIITNVGADFPRGLYVYMQLSNSDEKEPAVGLLNAHPPSR
jgi:hypothetical protein